MAMSKDAPKGSGTAPALSGALFIPFLKWVMHLVKLTEKQERFVQGLLKGLSQREAYEQAGYQTQGWRKKAVSSAACNLIKSPYVSKRYEQLSARLRQEAEAIITAKEVLSGITHIAQDDISNYLDFYTGEDGKVVVKMKDSHDIDTRNISEITLGRDGQLKFKLYERDTALYKLAAILGLNSQSLAAMETPDDGFLEALNSKGSEVFNEVGSGKEQGDV